MAAAANSTGAAESSGSMPSVRVCSSPRLRRAYSAAQQAAIVESSMTTRRACDRAARFARSRRFAGSRRPVQTPTGEHHRLHRGCGEGDEGHDDRAAAGRSRRREREAGQAACRRGSRRWSPPPTRLRNEHRSIESSAPLARSSAMDEARYSTMSRESRMTTTAATPVTPATMTDICASTARVCTGYPCGKLADLRRYGQHRLGTAGERAGVAIEFLRLRVYGQCPSDR